MDYKWLCPCWEQNSASATVLARQPHAHAWPVSPTHTQAAGCRGGHMALGPSFASKDSASPAARPAASDPSPPVPTQVFWTHPDPGRQALQPKTSLLSR